MGVVEGSDLVGIDVAHALHDRLEVDSGRISADGWCQAGIGAWQDFGADAFEDHAHRHRNGFTEGDRLAIADRGQEGDRR